MSESDRSWKNGMLIGGLVATVLVVYGSIVPLNYRPLEWEETFKRWISIPWYHLDVYHRADWIANGLIVIPPAFLLAGGATFQGPSRSYASRLADGFLIGIVLFFLVGVVFGIELLQVWFPPRTVSQNDIFSGWVGALVGVTTWGLFGEWIIGGIRRFLSLETFYSRLGGLAVLACILVSLYSIYPLDFMFSREEFEEKSRLGRFRWDLLPPQSGITDWLRGGAFSFARMIPFGVLLRCYAKPSRSWWLLILSAVILEAVQIPIYSKVTSLSDVWLGVLGGLLGWVLLQRNWFWRWIERTPATLILSTSLWALALVFMFDCRFDRFISEPAVLRSRWAEFFTYPMLRYYFTSEYSALTNLLGKLLSFGVLGALVASSTFVLQAKKQEHSASTGLDRNQTTSRGLWVATLLAVLVGVVIEVSQVYLEPLVPDCFDIAIYGAGAAAGAWITAFVLAGTRSSDLHSSDLRSNDFLGESEQEATLSASVLTDDSKSIESIKSIDSGNGCQKSWFRFGIGVAAFIGSILLAILHPVWPVLQVVVVIAVAIWIRAYPLHFPMLYVLAFVIGDAYPWTGQLALQEHDSILAGGLAGLLMSQRKQLWGTAERIRFARFFGPSWLTIGCWLMLSSLLVSGLVGAYRLPSAPWGDQLSVYFTKWNVCRIGKGILWGVVLIAISSRVGREAGRVWQRWGLRGWIASIWYVCLFVLFERAIFPGLFDWENVYRATGPFFSMHIGDQHIDAFLVLAFPFLCWAIVYSPAKPLFKISFGVLAFLLLHAVLATMSRGTIAMLLVETILLCVGLFLRSAVLRKQGRAMIAVVTLITIALVGSIVSLQSSAVRSRFATTWEDWGARWKHWILICRGGTTGLGGIVIGHGVGTLPSFIARDFGRDTPPLRWRSDVRQGLRQGWIEVLPAWPIYLERYLPPAAFSASVDSEVALAGLEVRPDGSDSGAIGRLSSFLVEKSLLQSYSEETVKLELPGEAPITIEFPGSELLLAAQPYSIRRLRTRAYGIHNSGDVPLRISAVTDESISSGVRGTSSSPWTFTCDDHMVWRAKNNFVHAYYEQGILGALAWATLLFGTILSCLQNGFLGLLRSKPNACPEQDVQLGWITATSILGFLGVAMFGTLIDTPWITGLVFASIGMRLIDINSNRPGLGSRSPEVATVGEAL